uniref:Ig-like domain-containing protein n=1 Tax=Heterorhabditis bacteriophora TaxID=37862 RepID=A0A1I7W8Q0_HETBA
MGQGGSGRSARWSGHGTDPNYLMCVCAHPAEVRSTLNWGFRLLLWQIEVNRSTGEFQCTWTRSSPTSPLGDESMPNFFSLRLLSLNSKNQTRVRYGNRKAFMCLNFLVSSGFKSPSKATHYEWLDSTTTTFRIRKIGYESRTIRHALPLVLSTWHLGAKYVILSFIYFVCKKISDSRFADDLLPPITLFLFYSRILKNSA